MPKLIQQITKKRLVGMRNALLQLHQKLLDYQRRSYEKSYGRINSTGKMFTLASNNKDFAWLRSLSELIVGLDAYIDALEFDTKNVRSLIAYTKQILTPNEKGGNFAQLYYEAVQTDPAILIAHRKVITALQAKTRIILKIKKVPKKGSTVRSKTGDHTEK